VDPETGLCPSHDPERRQAVLEAARKGGEATRRKLSRRGLEEGELPELRTPQDVARALEVVAGAVATGRLGHHEATAATRALRAWLDAHDAGHVSERLEALDGALREWKRTGDPSPVLKLVKG